MKTNCDNCINYYFNEIYQCYECIINLDEDEMNSFIHYSFSNCPYFKLDDEYGIVKKQI